MCFLFCQCMEYTCCPKLAIHHHSLTCQQSVRLAWSCGQLELSSISFCQYCAIACSQKKPNHVAMFAVTLYAWPGHRVARSTKINITWQSRTSLVIQHIHLLASIAKQVSLKKTWKFEDSMPLIISACSHWIAQKLLAKATRSCFASRCTCTLPEVCASAPARAVRMSWAAYLTVPAGTAIQYGEASH